MKIFTPQDLQNSYTQSPSGIWVVDNLLRTNRKRISLLCGSPHAGKSTIARQLALAVVHGESFLGRATLKTKVAYWQSEETEQDAYEDFYKSGMKPDDDIVILHSAKDNHRELNTLLCDDPDIRLVILETLDDFLQIDDLLNNTSARKSFEKFDAEIVEKHARCSFLALHHFKKSDEQRGSSLHKILGATVIAGKTDCKIYVRQVSDSDPRRILSVQTRRGLPIEPTYLVFNEATSTSTLGQTLAEERQESKKAIFSMNQMELRTRCVQAVAQEQGLPKMEYCERVGGNRNSVKGMFEALINDGELVQQVGGKTGTALLLYIKGNAPDTPDSEPQIPYADLPVCSGCGRNKVAGEAFNATWGAKYCSTVCQAEATMIASVGGRL
jgi:AAA domain